MATLTIRNLPQDVHDRLRLRAASHRRSMEAEARDMLAQQLEPAPTQDQLAAIEELREMGAAWRAQSGAPADWSFSDQEVAEQMLEGAWENGRVSDEERSAWLDLVNTYKVSPEELKAFVADRIR